MSSSIGVDLAIEESGLAIPRDVLQESPPRGLKGSPERVANAILIMDSGARLLEETGILQYIQDCSATLTPEKNDRYRVAKWLNFIMTEILALERVASGFASESGKAKIDGALAKCWALINKHVTGSHFLVGKKVSVADLYLYGASISAPSFQACAPDNPDLGRLVAKIASRPAAKAVEQKHRQVNQRR